jgi:hypothetical protein
MASLVPNGVVGLGEPATGGSRTERSIPTPGYGLLVTALVTRVGPSRGRTGSPRLPSPCEEEQPGDGHGGGVVEVRTCGGVQLVQFFRAR